MRVAAEWQVHSPETHGLFLPGLLLSARGLREENREGLQLYRINTRCHLDFTGRTSREPDRVGAILVILDRAR